MWTAKELGIYHFDVSNYSIVDFETAEDLANAIRTLDGEELKGNRVRLSDSPVRLYEEKTYVERNVTWKR